MVNKKSGGLKQNLQRTFFMVDILHKKVVEYFDG